MGIQGYSNRGQGLNNDNVMGVSCTCTPIFFLFFLPNKILDRLSTYQLCKVPVNSKPTSPFFVAYKNATI